MTSTPVLDRSKYFVDITLGEDGMMESAVLGHGYGDVKLNSPIYIGGYVADSDKEFDCLYDGLDGLKHLDRGRLWYIYMMAKQCLNLTGVFVECGVYAGGTAVFLKRIIGNRVLHLFDTFCGMPKTNPNMDILREGSFDDEPIDGVRKLVDAEFHQGTMPATFAGMDGMRIAFAHIDVDIYQSIKDCCEWVYPRLAPGGIMVIDDYGQRMTVGARIAVDEYFADKRSVPFPLLTGQAIVFKI